MDWEINGSYFTVDETKAAVLNLLEEGYPKTSITVFCREEEAPYFQGLEVVVETGLSPLDDDESAFWDKAKIFFGEDDITPEAIDFYREELAKGHLVVAMHDNPAYVEDTPVTNEEIVLDRALDISEENELANHPDDLLY